MCACKSNQTSSYSVRTGCGRLRLVVWSQLKQILHVSEEGEVLETAADAIREAKLFCRAEEPASHSGHGDCMSSAVQDRNGKSYAGKHNGRKRHSQGDPSLGDGNGGSVPKQARIQLENRQKEAEQLHSEPESIFFGVYIQLEMEMLDVYQDAVMDGRAWNDSPYAVVKGMIGTFEEQELFVHSVLGQGDCVYLALAITVFKAWGDGSTDALPVFPGECFKRLSQIIEIGKRNVQEEDTRSLEFRRLLADFAETGGDKLESALEACGAARPRTRTGSKSTRTRCQVQAAQMHTPGSYGDEGTLTVLKHFLPCLKLHFFVIEGSELVPCRHYLDSSMNAFPEGYDRFQLSIALHLRMAAGTVVLFLIIIKK